MPVELLKVLCKAAALGLAAWLAFALVASTLPYIRPPKTDESRKAELAQNRFYGEDASGPDRALVIEEPADALNVRIEMVRRAERALDIAYYKVSDGETTRALLGEIVAAADRGVRVRFLADGKVRLFASGVHGLLAALDAHPNIACRYYNPTGVLTPWRWHALLHDKFIIVDDDLLLLGGRNIDERHFPRAGNDRPITHDRDVLIWRSGAGGAGNPSAIAQTTAYMDRLWEYEHTHPVQKRELPAAKAAAEWDALRARAEALVLSDPQFYARSLQDYLDATVPTGRVTLITNPIQAGPKEPLVALQLAQLALQAKERVVVQTPYSTGNGELLSIMGQVAGRAELVMVTNSAASTPNYPAFSNYLGQRQKFVDTGAALYEYQGRGSLHAKSLVVDGRLSAVGSFNLDDRSFYIDTESMLIIDSVAFARQLEAAIDNLRAQSLQVGKDNTYLPGGVAALEEPPRKRGILRVVYYLLRPFQFLL